MANAFTSYIEKYLLNPASATVPDIEDDGNEETRANVTQRLVDEEGFSGASIPISKLRIQNSKLLSEEDAKYSGKKISRKDIQDVSDVKHDPELAKYFSIEDGLDDDDEESEEEGSPIIRRQKTKRKSLSKKHQSTKALERKVSSRDDDLFLQMGEDIESHSEQEESLDDEEELEESMDDEEQDEDVDDEEEQEEVMDDEGEEIDEDLDEEERDIEEGNDESESADDLTNSTEISSSSSKGNVDEHSSKTFKTFSGDDSDQLLRGKAVKNQCGIFDTLFEVRIGMQKFLSIANQLPQHDTYRMFVNNKDYPQYKANLVNARKSLKKLLERLLSIQETLLLKNSETKHILEESSTSSSCAKAESALQERESKGKRKVEEFEDVRRKRQKALLPYRAAVLQHWHEKSKMLGGRGNKGNKFASFDVPPSQQIDNILSNKDQLIKRTRVVGVSRGNVCKVLGKSESEQQVEDVSGAVEYDEEIFDDTDFYSRILEDLLKSKVSCSEDASQASQRWMDVQKLRRKAKKKVDTKASKGRKMRFQTMSKLQQYLVPCKPSAMEDGASNRLFSSLFDQSPMSSVGGVDLQRLRNE